MKKNLFLAGAAAVVLASCVQEQLVEGGNSFASLYGDDAISMRTFVGNSTKAGVVGIDLLQANGFIVYAQHDQVGASAATTEPSNANFPDSGDDWNIMLKKYVTWDGTDNIWTYSPVEYWPMGGSVDFYAYSIPGTRSTTAKTEIESDYDKDVTLATDGTATFTTRVLIDEQTDLLAGAALDRTKENSFSTSGVAFNFQHILSRVGFRAKAQSDFDTKNYKIVVNRVEVFYNTSLSSGKFIKKGAFDMAHTALSLTDASIASDIRDDLWDVDTAAGAGVEFSEDDAVGNLFYIDINSTNTLTQNATTGEVEYTRTVGADAWATKQMLSAGFTYDIAEAGDGIKSLSKTAVTIMDTDTRVSLTASDKYLMVIPQTYAEAKVTYENDAYTDDKKGALYVQVIFTVVKKDPTTEDSEWTEADYAINTEQTFVQNLALPLVKQTSAFDGVAAIDVPNGFNPGKTYTFEMEIGLKPIVFSTQIGVDEWVPATGEGSVPGEDGYHVEDDQVEENFEAGDPVEVLNGLTNAVEGLAATQMVDDADNVGLYKSTISWTPVVLDTGEVNNGYLVTYSAGTGSHSFTHAVEVVGTDTTSVTLTGLDGTLTYSVTIVAIGAPGQFGYSEAATPVTPAAPAV